MANLSASRRFSSLLWPATGLLTGVGLALWQGANVDLRAGAALALVAALAVLLGIAKTSSA